MEEHGKELAGYVANGNSNLKTYGSNITYDGTSLKTSSTKYTTTYPFDSGTDNTGIANNEINLKTANVNNYKKNTLIYGDGICETSTVGTGATSWYSDYSYYPGLNYPFSIHGGALWYGSGAGLVSFGRDNGSSNYGGGFRVVLTVS